MHIEIQSDIAPYCRLNRNLNTVLVLGPPSKINKRSACCAFTANNASHIYYVVRSIPCAEFTAYLRFLESRMGARKQLIVNEMYLSFGNNNKKFRA